jgi:hypothetical protein
MDPALSRWLDGPHGTVSPEEARLVTERLAADPRLAADVERLRADLDLFRADVASAGSRRATPGAASLADRVLARVAAGASDASDEERFHAVARRWSAAAAILVALGVGGSLALDRAATPAEAADAAALTSLVETHRFSLEVDLALDQRQVVAPVAPPADDIPHAPTDESPR